MSNKATRRNTSCFRPIWRRLWVSTLDQHNCEHVARSTTASASSSQKIQENQATFIPGFRAVGRNWNADFLLREFRRSKVVDDDKSMSSSRYWPPTSPEDLKTRAEEASVPYITFHLSDGCRNGN